MKLTIRDVLWLTAVVAMGFTVVAATAADTDTRLIGSWRLVHVEQYGKPQELKKEEQQVWEFSKKSITCTAKGEKSTVPYRVAGDEDPRGIEIKRTIVYGAGPGRQGISENYVILGIYRFRAGKLEICTCMDVDSPEEFVAAPRDFVTDEKDGRVVLTVFERVTKDGDMRK